LSSLSEKQTSNQERQPPTSWLLVRRPRRRVPRSVLPVGAVFVAAHSRDRGYTVLASSLFRNVNQWRIITDLPGAPPIITTDVRCLPGHPTFTFSASFQSRLLVRDSSNSIGSRLSPGHPPWPSRHTRLPLHLGGTVHAPPPRKGHRSGQKTADSLSVAPRPLAGPVTGQEGASVPFICPLTPRPVIRQRVPFLVGFTSLSPLQERGGSCLRRWNKTLNCKDHATTSFLNESTLFSFSVSP